jgi:ribosomal protein S18 acetylase RimI-like enzyme
VTDALVEFEAGDPRTDRVVRSLTSAFAEDPAMMHVEPDASRRPASVARLMRFELDRVLALDGVVHADPQGRGAALWTPPPGHQMESGVASLRTAARFVGVKRTRLVRALRLYGPVGARHPKDEPHWYLAVLGVDASAQGEGLGQRLITPILDRCDEEALPAYLETMNEANLAWYARFGFEVTDEVHASIPAWFLTRRPRK